jgi:DNA (cytosine-5)-methyltransferase 1
MDTPQGGDVRYGSICSGIEAATAAWHPLGWEPAFFAEIDKFPSAVLAHHYPEVTNHGDFTTITRRGTDVIDVLVGGTPCQSFSVAGKRLGLDDPRGNLSLEFLRLAQRLGPRWIVWENVPGVLSADKGRAFGTFLWLLGELGYGTAYRVLDAQYCGVPQRRRRVFVIGYLGDWRPPAEVLFERESLLWNPPPSREAGEDVAGSLGAGPQGSCTDTDSSHANGGGQIAIAIKTNQTGANGANISEGVTPTRDSAQPPAVAIHENQRGELTTSDTAGTLKSGGGKPGQGYPCVFTERTRADGRNLETQEGVAYALCNPGSGGRTHSRSLLDQNMQVRRLTPVECERLQGFPDNYTQIPWRKKDAEKCPDGPRYKALGNSMAVPVMRWIGERIQKVDDQLG